MYPTGNGQVQVVPVREPSERHRTGFGDTGRKPSVVIGNSIIRLQLQTQPHHHLIRRRIPQAQRQVNAKPVFFHNALGIGKSGDQVERITRVNRRGKAVSHFDAAIGVDFLVHPQRGFFDDVKIGVVKNADNGGLHRQNANDISVRFSILVKQRSVTRVDILQIKMVGDKWPDPGRNGKILLINHIKTGNGIVFFTAGKAERDGGEQGCFYEYMVHILCLVNLDAIQPLRVVFYTKFSSRPSQRLLHSLPKSQHRAELPQRLLPNKRTIPIRHKNPVDQPHRTTVSGAFQQGA